MDRFRERIYTTIQALAAAQGKTSIERMCELAGVSRAGFYSDWQRQEPSEVEMEIRDAIQKAVLKYRCYGYRSGARQCNGQVSRWGRR